MSSKSLLLVLFLAFLGLAYALSDAEIDQIINETIAELSDDDMAVTCRVNTASGLNFRTSPSTSASIIRALPNGSTGTKVADAGNGWVKITFSGKTGYVSGQYLSCSGSPGTGGGGGGGSGGSTGKTGTQGCAAGKNKYVETLQEVLGHEGSCQNSANDSGNFMNGKRGYTCAGITPVVGYNARNSHFSYAASSCGNRGEMFVKCAWDLNRSKFLDGASQVYRRNYFNVCDHLSQPSFFVCSDISVNSGPGRAQQFLRELGSCGRDVKAYATALNEKHRQFYREIGRPGTKNNKFLQGWLNRAAARDRFIQRC